MTGLPAAGVIDRVRVVVASRHTAFRSRLDSYFRDRAAFELPPGNDLAEADVIVCGAEGNGEEAWGSLLSLGELSPVSIVLICDTPDDRTLSAVGGRGVCASWTSLCDSHLEQLVLRQFRWWQGLPPSNNSAVVLRGVVRSAEVAGVGAW